MALVSLLRLTAATALALVATAHARKYDYKVSARPMQQDDAKQWCQSTFGGVLVSITSSQEKADIQSVVRNNDFNVNMYWTGLERKSNPTWQYVNGDDFVSVIDGASVWKNKEPNFYRKKEYCVAAKANTGLWNDVRCSQNYHAVCQRDHIANPFEAEAWHRRAIDGTTNCYYKYFNHILYKKLTPYVRKNWWDAEGACNSQPVPGKPHLAVINDEAENDFVENLVYNTYDDIPNRPVWMGARRGSSQWNEWVDGSKIKYNNWIPGEPNFGKVSDGFNIKSERCMQMSHGRLAGDGVAKTNLAVDDVRGKWNDADCNMRRGYVCELCTTDW